MRSIVVTFFAFLLMLQSSRIYGQKINTQGVTVIHVSSSDTFSTTIPVVAHIYHVFPAYDFSAVQDSLLPKKQQAWLKCPVRVTQTGYLTVGNGKIELLMIPGDTIHVTVSPASLGEVSYTFEGRTKVEQEYYVAKKKQFPIEPAQLGMNAGVKAKDLTGFQHQLDSLTNAESTFWQNYKVQYTLPDWFVRFESDAIRYSDAMLRLYMTWYQIDYQHKNQIIPANYFTFLEELPIQNAQAHYDYEYLNFLREYIDWKIKLSGLSNMPTTNRDKYQYALIEI